MNRTIPITILLLLSRQAASQVFNHAGSETSNNSNSAESEMNLAEQARRLQGLWPPEDIEDCIGLGRVYGDQGAYVQSDMQFA